MYGILCSEKATHINCVTTKFATEIDILLTISLPIMPFYIMKQIQIYNKLVYKCKKQIDRAFWNLLAS